MHKLPYVLLSFFLCFSIITTLLNFTLQASNPLFFNGGTVGVMQYKNSHCFRLIDYPIGCSDVWSCATVMQNLYFKHNMTGFMSININPFLSNITDIIYATPSYYITFYSIMCSIISISFSIIVALIIIIKNVTNQYDIDENLWTSNKKMLCVLLFLLRIPTYISVVLIYAYLMPTLIINNMSFQLKLNEYIRVFTLLAAYVIDNFIFPYYIIN